MKNNDNKDNAQVTPYIKPKCPTCGSVNWVPRLKTKDAFCRNCGGVFKLGEDVNK